MRQYEEMMNHQTSPMPSSLPDIDHMQQQQPVPVSQLPSGTVTTSIVDGDPHSGEAKAGTITFTDPFSKPSTLNYKVNEDCIDPNTGQVVKAGTTINEVDVNSKTTASHIKGHDDGRQLCVHKVENNGIEVFGQ